MKTIRSVALLMFLLLLPGVALSVQAQDLKVGYADPESIIAAMPEYQQIRQQLQGEVEAGQQALQTLAADFQDKVEKYQKQQPLLSAERRAEREQELTQLQGEIQQSAALKDQELAQREQDLMSPLLERVQGVIEQLAKEQGLDIVMRSPALLFANQTGVKDLNLDIASRLGISIDETASN